jgi:hypothetical protein
VGGAGVCAVLHRGKREGRGRGARITAHDEGLAVVEGAIFVFGGVGGGKERELLLAREGEVVT